MASRLPPAPAMIVGTAAAATNPHAATRRTDSADSAEPCSRLESSHPKIPPATAPAAKPRTATATSSRAPKIDDGTRPVARPTARLAVATTESATPHVAARPRAPDSGDYLSSRSPLGRVLIAVELLADLCVSFFGLIETSQYRDGRDLSDHLPLQRSTCSYPQLVGSARSPRRCSNSASSPAHQRPCRAGRGSQSFSCGGGTSR